jgi:hypothetical protein
MSPLRGSFHFTRPLGYQNVAAMRLFFNQNSTLTNIIPMRLLYFTVLLLLLQSVSVVAQSIFGNPITGTNPNTFNPYTNGQNVDPNISVSGIGRGSGISGNAANNRYNANSWNTMGIDLDAYFYFILTPNSGQKINFSSFEYSGQASGTGPTSFAFRSSLDGFTDDIGAPTASGATIDLSGAEFQNITSAIEFRFYGWGASAGGGTFSVNDFDFFGTTSLPIELISFRGWTDKETTLLRFSTATETNNDYFSIERSANGLGYVEIGRVKGAGTSFEPQEYRFIDQQPLSGKNYYRLRQVDFDGKFSLSPVVLTKFGEGQSIVLAPVPATETVRVQLDKSAKNDGLWQVFDLQGRVLLSGVFPAETTENNLIVRDLPEGTYFLRLNLGQEMWTERFQKYR